MTTTWQDHAPCRGKTHLYYPTDHNGHPINGRPPNGQDSPYHEARTICLACPYIDTCRATYMGEKYGMWFATTPEDRKTIRRHQRQAAA